MSGSQAMINAFDPAKAERLDDRDRETVAKRDRLLGPSYRLFYDQPFHPVSAQGVWLHDAHGQRFLDAYNNVPSVGHCHPRVIEAVTKQMSILNTHTRYLSDGVLDFAEWLLDLFPSALDRVMFTCTGSEANDLAIRVAKNATGGSGIIITRLAYHGVTETIAGLSPSLGLGVPPGRDVFAVDAPLDPRQGRDVAAAFALGVEGALAEMRRQGVRPAALLVDTIFSSDGIFSDPPGFLAPAVKLFREAGGLFIADEVQAGFGRTGDRFWGFQRHELTPDIVTMGKPMGNGYPVAAMVSRRDLLDDFGRKSRYFNTFGGSNVAMAAATAVLDIIRDEGLVENARTTGDHLRNGLIALSQSHPIIGSVRGAGLFIGVELLRGGSIDRPASQETAAVVNGLRERNILISASGPNANVLKIRPPLPFGIAEADLLLSTLDSVLQTIPVA
ncbi:aspartate aminotransferase family protein [Rhizobium sp. AG855]|uniref:aspartate aminotransferase family protein n=1 Tax=Rhizobium sp. AG855 TaxID=2183898 RepID=UPI000E7558A4|nr:aspartate aminotransferase family protein [Rhizobium sp. AG855]RKE84623.1 4-aminobutyrate aminotransferase-like enzyme [Rhizobium sp. AG855]